MFINDFIDPTACSVQGFNCYKVDQGAELKTQVGMGAKTTKKREAKTDIKSCITACITGVIMICLGLDFRESIILTKWRLLNYQQVVHFI